MIILTAKCVFIVRFLHDSVLYHNKIYFMNIISKNQQNERNLSHLLYESCITGTLHSL